MRVDRPSLDGDASGPGPGLVAASVAAAASALATGFVVPVAAGLGLAGAAALAVGVDRSRRWLVDLGGCGLAGGAVLAGAFDPPVGPVLVAGVAAVVAWDAAVQVLTLERHLGSAARGAGPLVAHVGATLLVATGGATLAYLAAGATAGAPPLPLAVLVVGAAVLAVALRE